LCLLDLPRLIAVVFALAVVTPSEGWLIAACAWCAASLAVMAWEFGRRTQANAVEV
jgi:hypothetical protein